MIKADICTVLIASPGDVQEERDAICAAILAWNSAHSETYGVLLKPSRWELDATPERGSTPQTIINSELVDKADILVGVFGTRLGTPTQDAASGTVEEIERFAAASKHVLLYFSDRQVTPSQVDAAQLQAVRDYRKKCEEKGLHATFDSVESLVEQLQRHLTKRVVEIKRTAGPAIAPPTQAADSSGDEIAHLEGILVTTPARAGQAFRSFVDSLNAELETTRPDFGQFSEMDEAVVQQVNDGLAVSSKFTKAADVAVGNESLSALKVLYSNFGAMLRFCYPPDDFVGGYSTGQFDGFKFLMYEMFVSLVALLVKAEQWNVLATLLKEDLFDSSTNRGGYVSFVDLSDHLWSIDESRNKRLGLRRLSVMADMLKARYDARKDSPLDHASFMAGDYFLFLRTVFHEADQTRLHDTWCPRSCLYLNRPPVFIRKCESQSHLDALAVAVAVESGDVVAERLRSCHASFGHFFRNGFSRRSPLEDFNLDKLGTRP